MFGVTRFIFTLKKAIENNEPIIKWCAHSEQNSGGTRNNSIILAKELLDAGGYKFSSYTFSIIRMHRVLIYNKTQQVQQV